MIQHDDVEGAYNQLLAWREKIGNVEESRRRLCIYQLQVALHVLVLARSSGHLAASARFEELERLKNDLRVVGTNELFIFNAIRSFLENVITLDHTISKVKSVIIPGSGLPRMRYVTVAAKEEDCFSRMPLILSRLLRKENTPELEELCYILLLYARCVAEFWSCIYKKRRAEGEVDRFPEDRLEGVSSNLEVGGETNAVSSDLEFPNGFGLTNWSDLRGCLCQLAAAGFKSEVSQKLSTLYLGAARFKDDILSDVRSGKLSVSGLADIVKGLIMETQEELFPHVVQLVRYVEERGRATLTVKRLWHGEPRELTLTHAKPQTHKLGRYYFLSPQYKRKHAKWGPAKIHPPGGSTCFGEPADKPVLLLVEGSTDVAV